jgi:lysophospholipase L1-like esterase
MGGWFIKTNQLDNLNVIRDKKYVYKTDFYTDSLIDVHYTRDKFGLRGKSSFNRPEKIDILTIGGSTTDQRYISDGETWQDVIENCYKQDGKNVVVANAGIDGQSTFGHIKNFEVWFPQIPQIKPKYILFYVGINDIFRIADTSFFDIMQFNTTENSINLLYLIKIRIKQNSIIYNFYLKMRGWINAIRSGAAHKNTDFSKYTYTDKGIASEKLYALNNASLSGFKNRLLKLVDDANAMGAEPIFVTQPSMKFKLDPNYVVQGISELDYIDKYPYNGVDYYNFILKINEVIFEVCDDKYTFIDLTKTSIWEQTDFYDMYHNTTQGAKKVGIEIYNKIKNKKI